MLTDRQAAVLDFVRRAIATGRPPTIREIGAKFGFSSPNGVTCHLHALEAKGFITIQRGARGIRLVKVRGLRPGRDRFVAWRQPCLAAAAAASESFR